MKRAGWIRTALLLAFLLPASVAPKLMGAQAAVGSLAAIGWPPGWLTFLGVLGGIIASHLRAGSPMASHTLFGLYLGVFLWAALYLRDARFREFVRGYFTKSERTP
jgi:hypothetical protein